MNKINEHFDRLKDIRSEIEKVKLLEGKDLEIKVGYGSHGYRQGEDIMFHDESLKAMFKMMLRIHLENNYKKYNKLTGQNYNEDN